jgi:hypothetical protein
MDTRDSYIVKAVVINYEGSLSMYHRDFQILLHEEFYEGLSEEERKYVFCVSLESIRSFIKLGMFMKGF